MTRARVSFTLPAVASSTPSTPIRSSIVARSQSGERPELVRDPDRQVGWQGVDTAQQAQALGSDLVIEFGVGQVQGGQRHARIEHVVVAHARRLGQCVLDVAMGRQVVGHHQFELVVDLGVDLVELQAQQTGIDPEFDDHRLDFVRDAGDHLAALHHRDHVTNRDDVFHLERSEVADRVVETNLVALERLQRLVGTIEQATGLLQLAFGAARVHIDHAHLLGRGDHRNVERSGDPFGGAVAGAGLAGGHRGIGHQVHVGTRDAVAVLADDDRAVHLGQLGKPLRAERRIDEKPARADRQHFWIVAEYE